MDFDMDPSKKHILSPCGLLVKQEDYERYLCSLFAHTAARERIFALYAFGHEIAKIRELVSEPMVGMIRLQWWREAIEGIYSGSVRKHEIVEALADTLSQTP